MHSEFIPKIGVSCRVPVELREQLESEAREQRQTLSAYIEMLLMRRVDVNVDVYALKMRIYQLEAENQALRAADSTNAEHSPENADCASDADTVIRTLKLQKMELQTELRRLAAERDTIMRLQTDQRPGWLSAAGYDKMRESISKMRERYPAASPEQVLLSALAVTWRNERSLFFVWTLGDYWERYPLNAENLDL